MPNKSYNQILDEHLHILIAQGNHEAYNVLRKRYHRHAVVLCDDLLTQYSETGITKRELINVCEDHFAFVVLKFLSGLSSFYSFWKESTLQVLMDYIIENSYDGEAYVFKGVVSFDQQFDEKHNYAEYIAERNEDKKLKRKLFEIKHIIEKFSVFFTDQEKALLNLILEGYTVSELEHSGMLAKSHLYLTYNTAVNKLRKLIRKSDK